MPIPLQRPRVLVEAPIEIRRSNDTPPVVWRFKNKDGSPTDLTGSVFTLVVAWPAPLYSNPDGAIPPGEIDHSSDPAVDTSSSALVIDVAGGTVTWPYTLAESDAIPRGKAQNGLGPRYVLRRTIAGRTRDWAGGDVTVRSFLP